MIIKIKMDSMYIIFIIAFFINIYIFSKILNFSYIDLIIKFIKYIFMYKKFNRIHNLTINDEMYNDEDEDEETKENNLNNNNNM